MGKGERCAVEYVAAVCTAVALTHCCKPILPDKETEWEEEGAAQGEPAAFPTIRQPTMHSH